MKPLAIADYLDHLGRAASEEAQSKREVSPFRPRSLQNGKPAPDPASDRAAKPGAVNDVLREERAYRPLWERKPTPLDAVARQPQPDKGAGSAEEIAVRLAEAHARGRSEGRAEGRAEALSERTAERAAVEEKALAQRLEFELNEYARLEAAFRSGFAQIEENVGTAVARILAPFLAKQVAQRVVRDLCEHIARLASAESTGLITIRGPERALALLRDRIADLSAKVEYVERESVEVVVEAKATRIATQLGPWSDLLASLDA